MERREPEGVSLVSRRAGTIGFYAVLVACAALLLADFAYTKHVHYAFERWTGFFAGYGFAAYVFIVYAAVALRRLVKRDEDYYD